MTVQIEGLQRDSQCMQDDIELLCGEYRKYNHIDPAYFEQYDVKRGLRNKDGTGVVAGLTQICNVHGYIVVEGEKTPAEGELTYRGIDINDLVAGTVASGGYGFEETAWLLLFGNLPNREQLEKFQQILAEFRELPNNFVDDMIIKAPSNNIMNKMARSVLALYSYDDNPEDPSIKNNLTQAIALIARMPTIMCAAYQVKRRAFDHRSMYFHQPKPEFSTAQNVLRTMRSDKRFEEEEAHLLDLCMVLQAEHGGGNNSAFTTRVVTSSGTDIYSAIAAAIGSLKGPLHGGANHKVMEMLSYIEQGVSHWEDDGEIKDFLRKLIRKEAGDGSGKVYGMGHAVYTKSDPRARLLKQNALRMAKGTDFEPKFMLLDAVERLTPEVFADAKGDSKVICANVDLYSGLVYTMLGIPPELHTPVFAISRMPGWCAHRLEEMTSGGRLMRPAYKALDQKKPYIPLDKR